MNNIFENTAENFMDHSFFLTEEEAKKSSIFTKAHELFGFLHNGGGDVLDGDTLQEHSDNVVFAAKELIDAYKGKFVREYTPVRKK
jgi:hypothetical protein